MQLRVRFQDQRFTVTLSANASARGHPHSTALARRRQSGTADHISDEGIQAGNRDYVGKVGLSADSYASIAAFLISQPQEVDINEIVFRPTAPEM